MKITNKLGLPEAIVKAVDTEPHNMPGEYSATTLIRGTKEILLTIRHWDEIEVDVADRIWAIFGTAVHSILEQQETTGFKEERVTYDMNGRKITGKMDLYDLEEKQIDDYKTGTIWKIIFNDFSDWEMQGKIYAWLLSVNDLPVKKVKFTAMLKDHSKRKARREKQYPNSPVYVHEFSISDEDLLEAESFIYEKVSQLKKHEELADDEIPACSENERWQKPSEWAVMKKGRKSAVRKFPDKAQAEELLKTKDADHYITERKAEATKCVDYCDVAQFCSFYRDHVAPGLEEDK